MEKNTAIPLINRLKDWSCRNNAILFLLIALFCSPFLLVGKGHDHLPASIKADWDSIHTVEQVWQQYPQEIRTVLAALDLQQPALQAVRSHTEAGDTISAASALLMHYRQSQVAEWLVKEPIAGNPEELAITAQQMLADTMSLREAVVRMPQVEHGGWQWDYEGPENDAEFGYSLNGHKYLPALISAWKQSGDEVYVKTFDRIIRDWIIHNPLPPKSDSIYLVLANTGLDWRDIGEVIWRTLEAGNRLGMSWPQAFYHFQASESFSPAARLLMLASLVEQARYLREHHKEGHNWTTMEMNGLALVGLTFPEFREANDWADYALQVMEQEIQRQVYPDGLQTELSSKTQWVALMRFESIADHMRKAGRSIQASYLKRVEDMYHFLAYSMRPDGHQALNNDSDREDVRPRVRRAAKIFNRPDWEWVASNGQVGQAPEGLPTIVFPWAGIHIMRSGWNSQAHWTFFDTGPYGTGHQHRDMLHLSISAYGKDFLVDGGRYTHKDYFSFDPTIWRGYFRSTFSHNTLLIDGKGQKAGPLRAVREQEAGVDFLNTAEFDYARGMFSSGYEGIDGDVKHHRAVLYIRENCWLVVDHVDTDRPRQVEALWHYAPNCVLEMENGILQATQDDAQLQLIPIGKSSKAWAYQKIQGQEEPFIQGWYSADYGSKEANPTAVFSQTIQEEETFVWLLVPSLGAAPQVKVKKISERADEVEIRIKIDNQETMTALIPWKTGKPEVRRK